MNTGKRENGHSITRMRLMRPARILQFVCETRTHLLCAICTMFTKLQSTSVEYEKRTNKYTSHNILLRANGGCRRISAKNSGCNIERSGCEERSGVHSGVPSWVCEKLAAASVDHVVVQKHLSTNDVGVEAPTTLPKHGKARAWVGQVLDRDVTHKR
jgi:hypothetical protein